MKYLNILKASKSEAIFPVVAGLAVEADGYMLSAEQMDNVDAALAQAQAQADTALEAVAQEQIAQLQANLQTEAENLATAQQSLATAQEQITQLQANLQAEAEALQLAQADLTTAQQQAAALQTENDRLKNETPTPDDTRTDADQVNKTKKKTRNSFDRYADEMIG